MLPVVECGEIRGLARIPGGCTIYGCIAAIECVVGYSICFVCGALRDLADFKYEANVFLDW